MGTGNKRFRIDTRPGGGETCFKDGFHSPKPVGHAEDDGESIPGKHGAGIARHNAEGVNFKNRAEEIGWKEAVRERDEGIFDWTEKRPIP